MATNTGEIAANLAAFYDFTGRTVVDVGAGGGQLVAYARAARAVFAVDPDVAALDRLAARARESGLADRFTLLGFPLLDVTTAGDVVLFEFCLHQMPDPARALDHARTLARDVVIVDHAPGSPWSWCAAEEGQVERAWQAVERHAVRRRRVVVASQQFADGAELVAKLADCGPESVRRIETYRGQHGIAIAMPYQLALL